MNVGWDNYSTAMGCFEAKAILSNYGDSFEMQSRSKNVHCSAGILIHTCTSNK